MVTAIQEIGLRMDQALKLAEQAFGFACQVQERFTKGDADAKKEILATMSSNLILRDKRLLIEARKPFVILGDTLYAETPEISPIEPEKKALAQGRKIPSVFLHPQMRGERDDVRTYLRKAERAATLIYAHFKKEFGMPDKY